MEAWHSNFAKVIATKHPNIWKFIVQIRKELRDNEITVTQLQGGHSRIRQPISKGYGESQRMLIEIVNNYDEYKEQRNILLYLRAACYRLKRY